MREFYCANCGEKVKTEFLKPGEKFFHRECGGETAVPDSEEVVVSSEARARYEKYPAEKIVKIINQGMNLEDFEIAREVLEEKLASTSNKTATQNGNGTAVKELPIYEGSNPNNVVVTGIKMTLGSIFIFSLKWVIASIPAILLVYASLFLIGLILGGIW